MNKKKVLPYFKVIAAMVIVGSSVVAGKILIQTMPIFLASELRFLVASLILVPLLIFKEGIPSLNKKDIVILFFQSLTGVFLFSVFMLYGLKFTTALEAGIITSTLPAMVALLAFFIIKEKLTKNKIVGILTAILGVIILNFAGVMNEMRVGHLELLGNLLILGAVIGEALFIILGKSLSKKISPLAISTGVSIMGVLLFLPLAMYEAINSNYTFRSVHDWLLILYFGIVVTVLAFLLMYQGVAMLPATTVGILTSILPLSTFLLSFFFLQESFYLYHFIGGCFIIFAIYLTTRGEKLQVNKDVQIS
ncbi:EamA family transporter [Anaerobacillus alkalidiazotrophicus]|uniref:EamA family transporter n=1 Tax=Anaerobacillus alkalidiazotrophicus TaxID=472963 RepID=A0A1S2MCL8_9BACI|nr:DMT family transporter [Anaerobacillus alkalidiazotrophicus]OIJ22409.1 EamA family transporter [Anaerobacillus alkalidiazotrophicus]